ncbi:MAG TPA: Ig-like domain-containing protein [Gemmatimonadaceae bacterium]
MTEHRSRRTPVAGRSPGKASVLAWLGIAICVGSCGGGDSAAPPPPPPPPELPASIVVTPGEATLVVGGTMRLGAEARDRNGALMSGQQFTWTSDNGTVASVDGTGLVTGVGAGRATIIARSGAVSGSAQVQVAPKAFAPARDTTVSGSVLASHFTVPAGVTVTITSDLALVTDSLVRIAGTLTGNCVAIDIRGRGDLEVTGTINNTCSDSTAVGRRLRIVVDGTMTLDGARITSWGDIDVANDSTPPALFWLDGSARAVGSPAFPTRSISNLGGNSCNGRNAAIHGRSDWLEPAASGSPTGASGSRGGRMWISCDGDLTLDGVDLRGGTGQRGGNGTATPTAAAGGGTGGDGGEVRIAAAGNILFRSGQLQQAYGGAGGSASSVSSLGQKPEAYGGAGGNAGPVRVIAGGGSVKVEPGGLTIEFRSGGSGGSAIAQGRNGADAGNQAATPGEAAKAEGGKGGNVGFSPGLRLVGDLIQGTVTGAANISIALSADFDMPGGAARVAGGSGGNGSAQFPDGASGGGMTGIGGKGGDVWIQDNRTNTWLGPPGNGGNVTFRGALGGAGFGTCQSGTLQRGGVGGKGGRADGTAGLGGRTPAGVTGTPGRTYVGGAPPSETGESSSEATGNGGRGGDGNPAGAGGGAGERAFATVGAVIETHNQLFQPGAGGMLCPPPPPPLCDPTKNPETSHLLDFGDALGERNALCSAGTSLLNTSPVFHPSHPTVPTRPRAGDHTTTKFLGGTGPRLLSPTQAQTLDALMNQPNRIRLGPTTPLSSGEYYFLYNVMSAPIPTSDAGNQYQYRFLFDCDAVTGNNYVPALPYDFTRNTDFWVDVLYSGTWSLQATFAQNNNPFTFASGARAVIIGPVIVLVVPRNVFPALQPGVRFTTFRHRGDGGVGGDWDGDVQPPVMSPLYVLPIPAARRLP